MDEIFHSSYGGIPQNGTKRRIDVFNDFPSETVLLCFSPGTILALEGLGQHDSIIKIRRTTH